MVFIPAIALHLMHCIQGFMGIFPNGPDIPFDLKKAFNLALHSVLWKALHKYGNRGPLLGTITVHDELWQSCPLSMVLFINFMNKLSWLSTGQEDAWLVD